ncbi:MAG: hypothetical protein IJ796_07810 [Lachnospiraceae bacterium]|nr:hypothetical protein [Lachnospiraceae bacterium]
MGSLMDNLASTVTGNVAKAVIKIKDKRNLNEDDLNEREMAKIQSTIAFGDIAELSAIADAANAAAGALKDVADALGVDLGDGYTSKLEVQFNPTSIRISGYAGDDDAQIMDFSQNGRGLTAGALSCNLQMSVNLIFDQISNTAAFQQDMLTFSSSSLASMGKGALTAAKDLLFGGKKLSLQMIVEAFVATMRNEKTREVCFEWGDMKYEGVLRQVNTDYTMFDINGNPVRATVGLSIYLRDNKEDYSNGYWFDAYTAAFIDGNPMAMAALKMANTKTT